MKKNKREKRRFARVMPDAARPVKVDVNGRNFVDVFNAHDISEGGLSVQVPHGFEGCSINEPVELVINLPEPVPSTFTATGKIKHIAHEKFGVVFLAINQRNRKLTQRYVSHRLRHKTWWARVRRRLAGAE